MKTVFETSYPTPPAQPGSVIGNKGSPRLLKRAEVAAQANVHIDTVRNWDRRGLLHPVVIGKKFVRYKQSDLDQLLGMAT